LLTFEEKSLQPEPAAERLRVARIIDRLNVGGPAKHVIWLTACLERDGFKTVLITGTVPPGEGDMGYFAREAGVKPLVIEEMSRELSPRDLLVVIKLVRQLWQLKPDIIHTHKAKAGAAGRVAALIYKWVTPSALWLRPRQCRVVHTFHGHIFHSYYGPAKTRIFLAIERALARLGTDCIIVISEQQRDEIAGRFRVGRPEQFRVIPLGVDWGESNGHPAGLRSELGLGPEELAVGIVGRLCEVKNHAMLLDAAEKLVSGDANLRQYVRFLVVGDGHLRQELEARARRLGIDDRVIFTGFRDDALALYRDLDLVVLTSLNEGTPLTLIEALGCGRAVAATEVGGVVNLMGGRRSATEGFTIWDHGVTAPSRDAAAFARAMRFLLERPELRREMGEQGSRFARAQLSKERLVRDIEDLYRELAHR